MSVPTSEGFDCVNMMRDIRDKLGAEIRDMSHEQLREWLHGHRYSDPFLQRLAERAAQQTPAANEDRLGNTGV